MSHLTRSKRVNKRIKKSHTIPLEKDEKAKSQMSPLSDSGK